MNERTSEKSTLEMGHLVFIMRQLTYGLHGSSFEMWIIVFQICGELLRSSKQIYIDPE
jgi:hypothetical protein